MFKNVLLIAVCLVSWALAQDEEPADGNSSTNECPEGWNYFEGAQKCYKIATQKGTWDQAEAICEENDATLVSIHSPEENNFVVGLAQNALENGQLLDFDATQDGLWIGLKTPSLWQDDTQFDFQNWNTIEPNKDDSGALNLEDGNGWTPGVWFTDLGNERTYYGICQKMAQTNA